MKDKNLLHLEGDANQITTHDDITKTDDVFLDLSRKIFVHHYREQYQKMEFSLYQTGSFKHPENPSLMITPHFIRDDRVIIYLQLLQNNIYLKMVPEEIIQISMEILNIKNALLFTIVLEPNFDVTNISNILSDTNESYLNIIEKKYTFSPDLSKKYMDKFSNKIQKLSDAPMEKNVIGFIKDDWVSASKTRNYALKDTLIDWLDYWYDKSDEKEIFGNIRTQNEYDFTKFIMNKGIQFEKHVINLIRNKIGKGKMVTICQNMNNYHKKVPIYEKQTEDEMMKGTPLIYQAVLLNRSGPLAYSYGMPDLLVRSDYLDKIVEFCPLDDKMKKLKAPGLKGNYHYVVVDIKFTTLEFCADGIRLRNSGSIPAYKNQLYIYNHALGRIQGYEPTTSYILGRKYKYETKGIIYSGNNCFDRLGCIQYNDWDNDYIDESARAIDWIKNLRNNGKKWKLLPKPSVPELYPNMSSSHDTAWDNLKMDYANKIGEITLLWNCGVKNRKIAHKNGVYSFRDDKCSSDLVGIHGPKQAPVLDEIIQINRKRKFENPIDRLEININDDVDNQWMESYKLRITVDFETIGCLFDDFKDLPLAQDNIYLFMIGVAYQIYDQEPEYKMFLISELSKDAEFQIIYQFYQYLRKLTDKHLGKHMPIPSLYHWGHIERSFFSGLCERLHETIGVDIKNDIKLMQTKLDWYDVSECFKNNPIVINGCFRFGLKEVVNRLSELELIHSNWQNNNKICNSGNTAMIMAYNAYQTAKETGSSIIENPVIDEIRNYNKIDCIVIHEIIDLLRRKAMDNGLMHGSARSEPVKKKRKM